MHLRIPAISLLFLLAIPLQAEEKPNPYERMLESKQQVTQYLIAKHGASPTPRPKKSHRKKPGKKSESSVAKRRFKCWDSTRCRRARRSMSKLPA